MNLTSKNLLDFSQTITKSIFEKTNFPWEVLKNIKNLILNCGNALPKEEYEHPEPDVWIHKDAEVSRSAYIDGPTIIQKNSKIRHCAFIRGCVIIGENCIIGNSTEIKNSILFNDVQIPHFNYVGDSVLGFKVHLGAGAITSNVRSDKGEIIILNENKKIVTDLTKFGAIIGDFSEIGCNAVLNPGTILGRHTTIYPLSMVRGTVAQNSILKNNGDIIKKFKKGETI